MLRDQINNRVIAMVNQLTINIPAIKNDDERKALAKIIDQTLLLNSFEKNNEAVISALQVLQELVFADYCTHRGAKRELIDVLIKHKISPLAPEHVNETNYTEAQKNVAVAMQRAFRSKQRAKLHLSIFRESAKTPASLSLEKIPAKAKKIIYELTSQHAAVNHLVHHWTTLPNFKNILRNASFRGSKYLDATGILYKKNSLTSSDIRNGDGNIICFCPHFVDYMALLDNRRENSKLREHLIRVTIDLTKIQPQEKYNQFFKLFDFLTPDTDRIVKLTNQFQVRFKKSRDDTTMDVTFTLNDKSYIATIHKKDAIFYGNLYAINRFCLLKMFSLIEAARSYNSQSMKNEFYTYLETLSEEEVRKILILFTQNLTIYAEYNFNGILPITDGLITEVYFVATHTLATLTELSPDQQQDALLRIVVDEFNMPIRKIPPLLEQKSGETITLYGENIIFVKGTPHVYPTPHDFSDIDAQLFAQDGYIETRKGVEEFLKQASTGECSPHTLSVCGK